MPWYAVLIWIFLIGGVIYFFIRQKRDEKKYEGVDMPVDYDWYEKSQALYPEDEGYHAYYFCYDDKKVNPGHRLVDHHHQVIYEAKIIIDRVVKDDEVDFINHINGLTSHHQIESSNGETMDFDGKDIWEYFEELGFTHRFKRDHGLTYTVDMLEKKPGDEEPQVVARLYSSNGGKNYFEEKGDFVPRFGFNGSLIVQCQHKYLDAAFLLAIAVTRTEASIEDFD